VLDLETLDGQSPAEVLQWTLAFLSEADALFGRQTMVYTDTGFWQALQALPGCQVLASRPLWLAAYSADPHVPPPWAPLSSWTFWQYSDGSTNGGSPVAGVAGAVDQNWFAGSVAQLAALG
jgi:lysozyme